MKLLTIFTILTVTAGWAYGRVSTFDHDGAGIEDHRHLPEDYTFPGIYGVYVVTVPDGEVVSYVGCDDGRCDFIELSQEEAKGITLKADPIGPVASVKVLIKDENRTLISRRIENQEPFSASGNTRDGGFKPLKLQLGQNDIVFVPFKGPNGTGLKGSRQRFRIDVY